MAYSLLLYSTPGPLGRGQKKTLSGLRALAGALIRKFSYIRPYLPAYLTGEALFQGHNIHVVVRGLVVQREYVAHTLTCPPRATKSSYLIRLR